MRMIYGTLGWHIEYLQPAIRAVENPEILAFYYGYIDKDEERRKTIETKDRMVAQCEKMKIKACPRQIGDPYDFVNIVKQIKVDVKKDIEHGNEIIVFSIAGGTKPMCSAALMVCIFKGIPTLYINEHTLQTIQLPLLQTDYLDALTKTERKLIEYLIEHKDDRLTQSQIAKIFKKNKATINPQILSLKEKGLLDLVASKDGREKIVKLSDGTELLIE